MNSATKETLGVITGQPRTKDESKALGTFRNRLVDADKDILYGVLGIRSVRVP